MIGKNSEKELAKTVNILCMSAIKPPTPQTIRQKAQMGNARYVFWVLDKNVTQGEGVDTYVTAPRKKTGEETEYDPLTDGMVIEGVVDFKMGGKYLGYVLRVDENITRKKKQTEEDRCVEVASRLLISFYEIAE